MRFATVPAAVHTEAEARRLASLREIIGLALG
jgi:hypothetical protein